MTRRKRRLVTPKLRAHRFVWDPAILAVRGHLTCRVCGSLESASVHRTAPAPPAQVDYLALAAGERDDQDEPAPAGPVPVDARPWVRLTVPRWVGRLVMRRTTAAAAWFLVVWLSVIFLCGFVLAALLLPRGSR